MCGKNLVIALFAVPVLGSPPRVREKLHGRKVTRCLTIITPACAGKTDSCALPSMSDWDHPRVCGKNCCQVFLCSNQEGSPPRVREKLSKESGISYTTRITPACAGKTLILNKAPSLSRDHPRVCGKNRRNTSMAKR